MTRKEELINQIISLGITPEKIASINNNQLPQMKEVAQRTQLLKTASIALKTAAASQRDMLNIAEKIAEENTQLKEELNNRKKLDLVDEIISGFLLRGSLVKREVDSKKKELIGMDIDELKKISDMLETIPVPGGTEGVDSVTDLMYEPETLDKSANTINLTDALEKVASQTY